MSRDILRLLKFCHKDGKKLPRGGEGGLKKGREWFLWGKGCPCGFLTELEGGKGKDWESLGELREKVSLRHFASESHRFIQALSGTF